MEIIAVIFVALIFSAWLRISQYRQDIEMKTMASPLSLAIQDLIATAGGIYLSITLLVSFLQIIVPDKVVIFAIEVEPIALISIGLAVLQPIIEKLMKWVGI